MEIAMTLEVPEVLNYREMLIGLAKVRKLNRKISSCSGYDAHGYLLTGFILLPPRVINLPSTWSTA